MNIGVAAAIPQAPAPSALPLVMKVPDLVELLGMPRSTVYALIAAKVIPARRAGKRWLLHGPTIESWLAGRAPEAEQPKRGRR